ncbi:sensor histidine kinase [Vibrio sp. TRT 1302]|uniref:sensor histidine kinase n=1 Tax=Vibrio sp. TRT 1302 TaxID=3418504 RepID=UPI003CE73FFE
MLGLLALLLLAIVAVIYANSHYSGLKSQLTAQDGELKSALKRLEDINELLVQNEQQASLGMLVAGIAHEVNTPIGICVTASSNLQHEIRELRRDYENKKLSEENLLEFLDICEESAMIIHNNNQRASELIRSFKQIAVDQSSDELREFNLRQYLDEILVSMRPRLKKSPHQITIHCPEKVTCRVYAGSLAQIVTNLIMNSLIHAFDDGEKGSIEIRVSESDNRIHFIYSDNGKGLSEEDAQRLFDPFFTTKRNQGGSGLGAHLIHNLITRKLGGSVSVETKLGEGLRYIIDFPKNANAATP